MDRRVISIDPHLLADSRPAFAHATTSTGTGRLIMTAGQVGIDEHGNVPNDMDEQIKLAFANLKRCLEAAGASITDILKLVYYIVNYDPERRQHLSHLLAFLNGHRPAITLVPVPQLAKREYLFEVEAYISVSQRPLREVDVVVVGAGLSGLKAASEVQKAGYSCAVVEARDRVGGKTYSSDYQDDGKIIELGAAWINDTNQPAVFALSQSLGLETVVQNTRGNVLHQDFDGSLSQFSYGSAPERLCEPNGSENVEDIRQRTEEACQKLDIHDPVRTAPDLDKLSFRDWVKSQGGGRSALASASIWTGAMLGMEPDEISALYFLTYCKSGGGLLRMRSDKRDGGQFLRLKGGTQKLSIGLANSLKPDSLVLKSPVRLVQQRTSGVFVAAGRGDFLCRRVIISVPTPLYKEITFDPPLQIAKTELGRQNKLGYINKILVVYHTAWWRRGNLCGMLQAFKGPISLTRDTSTDEVGQYSLTCFSVGNRGRGLSRLTQVERFQAVLDHIKETLGAELDVPKPISVQEYEWSGDQWAQGGPCPAAPPGVMTQFEHALRTPHFKIHFVGTETAYEWKGYMEGALLSGIRGAQEVMSALDGPKL